MERSVTGGSDYFISLFDGGSANQLGDSNLAAGEHLLHLVPMLLGEEFGGSENGYLAFVGDGYQRRIDRHGCFSGTDIALEQAVHRPGLG